MRKPRKIVELADRFWPKVAPPNERGCREWTGARGPQGYGMIAGGPSSVPPVLRTSRVAYCLVHGLGIAEIDGFDICHSCDTPACCEPAHLFLGTVSDNMRDMYSKGRGNPARGSRASLAKLTDAQVIALRKMRADTGAAWKQIGAHFGVSDSAARCAGTGATWKDTK